MKVSEVTNVFGDRKIYDLFLLVPSVNQLPCIEQYYIYGRVYDSPMDLEPVRVIEDAIGALTFCQQLNESRKEINIDVDRACESERTDTGRNTE